MLSTPTIVPPLFSITSSRLVVTAFILWLTTSDALGAFLLSHPQSSITTHHCMISQGRCIPEGVVLVNRRKGRKGTQGPFGWQGKQVRHFPHRAADHDPPLRSMSYFLLLEARLRGKCFADEQIGLEFWYFDHHPLEAF